MTFADTLLFTREKADAQTTEVLNSFQHRPPVPIFKTGSVTERLSNAEVVVDAVATNLDVLHRQLKAYGDATAEALTAIEARLQALEARLKVLEPPSVEAPEGRAVPV